MARGPQFAQFRGVGVAPLRAGAEPVPVRNAAGAALRETAGLFADLSNVVAREEKVQAATYLTETGLDIRETATRLELQHQADPEAFDAAFSGFGEGLIGNAPPALRDQVAAEVRARGLQSWARLATARQRRQNEQGRLVRFAGLDAVAQDFDAAMREGRVEVARDADGKPVLAGDAMAHGRRYAALLDAMVAGGDLTGAQAAARLSAFEREGRRQVVLGEFDRQRARGLDAAETYIHGIDTGTDVADPVERAALVSHMRGQLADLKAERRQDLAQVRARAAVAVDAVTSGRAYPDMARLKADAARIGDGETVDTLARAEDLARGLNAFARLPLGDQAAEIRTRSGRVETAMDNKRLDAMARIHRQTAHGLAKEPIAFAEAVGVRDFGTLDFADPQTFARRVRDGAWLADRYALPEVPILKAAEAEDLKRRLSAATPAEKTVMLGAMAAGLGAHLPAVLAAVKADDPEFAHAGAIAAQDPAAAQAILEGQEIRKIAPKFTPKRDATYREAVQAALPGAVFRGMDADFAAGLEETALSVYAGLARQADDVSKEVDTDRLRAAVKVVTGGLVTYDRPGLGTGTAETVAPVRGMTDDQFDALMTGLTDADLGDAYLPQIGKDTGGRVSARDVRQLADLVWLGDGRYALEIAGATVLRGDGRPAILDLGAIARGAAGDREAGP